MSEVDGIPRLFRILRDGNPVGEGVHWPAGPVNVCWTVPDLALAAWDSLEAFGATQEIADGTLMVVWRRQDTYTDPVEPA